MRWCAIRELRKENARLKSQIQQLRDELVRVGLCRVVSGPSALCYSLVGWGCFRRLEREERKRDGHKALRRSSGRCGASVC